MHTFRVPRVVYFLEELYGIRATATNLTVPKQQTLRFNVTMNESANGGPEGLLLIRS